MNKIKKSSEKINVKKLLYVLLIVFTIILLFTFIDYLFHQLSEEYAVPSYYFRNKVIFGTILGFVLYWFIRKKPLITKSFIFSAVIAVLLQIRYTIEGYPLDFVITFLFIHFFALWISSWLIMKYTNL